MKKLTVILFTVLFIVNTAFTELVMIYSGSVEVFSAYAQGMLRHDILVQYNEEDHLFSLYIQDLPDRTSGYSLKKTAFFFSEEQFQILRTAMQKHLAWVHIAKEKNVHLNKKVPNSALTIPVIWSSNGKWHSSNNLSLELRAFCGYAEYFGYAESLNIEFEELIVDNEQSRSIRFATLDFNTENVEAFLASTTQEHIQKKRDEKKLFN